MLKAIAVVAALAISAGAAAQSPWPSQPVKVVIAGAAGSATDIVARVFTEAFSRRFGQPFIADPRPGANGIIATEAVARMPADGHALLFTYAAAQVVNQALLPKPTYDGDKDFAAIAQVGSGGNVLVVPTTLPVRNVGELVAYARSRPARALSYGSWGIGSGGHLSMEALLQQTGVEFTHVPYKAPAGVVNDLLGGQLSAAFLTPGTAIPLIKAGKLRAIACSAPTRTPLLPDVPTLNEQGVRFDLVAWFGLFAPAGTPAAIVSALNSEVNRLLQTPEVTQRLLAIGVADVPLKTPEEFADTVRRDIRAWGDVVRAANIRVE